MPAPIPTRASKRWLHLHGRRHLRVQRYVASARTRAPSREPTRAVSAAEMPRRDTNVACVQYTERGILCDWRARVIGTLFALRTCGGFAVSALPKALLALLLVLPGGLIVAPLLLLCLRWHARREALHAQSQQPSPVPAQAATAV